MKSLVVLVSGSGSNLQRILDTIESEEIPNAKVELVVADRVCYGLERAKNNNIPYKLIPRGSNFIDQLKQALPNSTDLIVLAGFLSILDEDFCKQYSGRIINIHPSLLPKFGGHGMWGNHVHDAVLKANEKQSGATVHYVTSGVDEGEIILQKSVDVSADDNIDTLVKKVHKIEYEIFPKAINLVLNKSNKK